MPFKAVGDLRLPEGGGPHPVVVFAHGDGPNNRASGVTYPPIMERMLRAGYATFAWDKPGTGESTGEFEHGRVLEQRAQIVLDAVAVLKQHAAIDPEQNRASSCSGGKGAHVRGVRATQGKGRRLYGPGGNGHQDAGSPWVPNNPVSEYFFDPMSIIARTTIPVLAFFGEKDTQEYLGTLEEWPRELRR